MEAEGTKEVRAEAVNLAISVGALEASQQLTNPLKTLGNWMWAANTGQESEVGKHQPADPAPILRTAESLIAFFVDLRKNLQLYLHYKDQQNDRQKNGSQLYGDGALELKSYEKISAKNFSDHICYFSFP